MPAIQSAHHVAPGNHFPQRGAEWSAYACSKVNAENWLRCLQPPDSAYIFLRLCGTIEGGGSVEYMTERYPATVEIVGSRAPFDPENARIRS